MRYVMVLALLVGCSASDSNPDLEEMEEGLRLGGFPLPGGPYPGNGDIAIYEGPTATSEDCLIYTTIGTQVNAGAGPSSTAIMTVEGSSIKDPLTNAVVCSREGNQLFERVRTGSDGPVLFTVFGRWVFDGEVNFNQSVLNILQDLDEQLLYTFKGATVYEHSPWDGEALVTANTPIQGASSMRKLVISSLIAGECGGLGLYAEEESPTDDHVDE